MHVQDLLGSDLEELRFQVLAVGHDQNYLGREIAELGHELLVAHGGRLETANVVLFREGSERALFDLPTPTDRAIGRCHDELGSERALDQTRQDRRCEGRRS